MLAHELEGLDSISRKFFPIFSELLLAVLVCIFSNDILLIEKVKLGSIGNLSRCMDKVRIGTPHKIMHILSLPVPGDLFGIPAVVIFRIAVANFLRILEITGSAHHVRAVDRNTNIESAPNAVKFTSDIGIGMPAVIIIG